MKFYKKNKKSQSLVDTTNLLLLQADYIKEKEKEIIDLKNILKDKNEYIKNTNTKLCEVTPILMNAIEPLRNHATLIKNVNQSIDNIKNIDIFISEHSKNSLSIAEYLYAHTFPEFIGTRKNYTINLFKNERFTSILFLSYAKVIEIELFKFLKLENPNLSDKTTLTKCVKKFSVLDIKKSIDYISEDENKFVDKRNQAAHKEYVTLDDVNNIRKFLFKLNDNIVISESDEYKKFYNILQSNITKKDNL